MLYHDLFCASIRKRCPKISESLKEVISLDLRTLKNFSVRINGTALYFASFQLRKGFLGTFYFQITGGNLYVKSERIIEVFMGDN